MHTATRNAIWLLERNLRENVRRTMYAAAVPHIGRASERTSQCEAVFAVQPKASIYEQRRPSESGDVPRFCTEHGPDPRFHVSKAHPQAVTVAANATSAALFDPADGLRAGDSEVAPAARASIMMMTRAVVASGSESCHCGGPRPGFQMASYVWSCARGFIFPFGDSPPAGSTTAGCGCHPQ